MAVSIFIEREYYENVVIIIEKIVTLFFGMCNLNYNHLII